MSFRRAKSRTHPELLVSHCVLCGEFIAASKSKLILIIVEALHRCRKRK